MSDDRQGSTERVRPDDPILQTFQGVGHDFRERARAAEGKDRIVFGIFLGLLGMFLIVLSLITTALGIVSLIGNLFRRHG